MALIQCPECRAEVSNKAQSCPKCGYPIPRTATPSQAETTPREPLLPLIFSLMARPRETFAPILEGPRGAYTWPLLFLFSIAYALSNGIKEKSLTEALLWLVIGPLFLFAFIWAFAFVSWSFGKALGGTGKPKEIFDYELWISTPFFFTTSLNIVKYLADHPIATLCLNVVNILINLWVTILSILLLAMTHRFSMARSAAVVIFSTALAVLIFRLFGNDWSEILKMFFDVD